MSNALARLSYYKQNFSFCRELNISICPVSQNSEQVSRAGRQVGHRELQKVKPAVKGMERLHKLCLEGHFGDRETGTG